MPAYNFKCNTCTKEIKKLKKENPDNEDIQNSPDVYVFEITQRMNDDHSHGTCPICEKVSKKRVFDTFTVIWGRTAAELAAGTTKGRFEMGKYMKDAREKRKKEADPNSRDAISNELWTGTEVDRGVIAGPEKK